MSLSIEMCTTTTTVHMAEGVADFLNLEQVEFKWREVKYFIVFLTEHLRIIS
jgi:hypothetical protein